MIIIQQILFVLITAAAIFFFAKRVRTISQNIQLGRPEDRSDRPGERFKNMTLFALGQKKMFQRIVPAVFHFLIYIGFILINIEIAEIFLDGLTGKHRVLSGLIGPIYPVAIGFFELLAVGVIVACIVFLARRDLVKLSRFWKREMEGWPHLDARIILWVELALMVALLVMNAADYQLQQLGEPHYPQVGAFAVSQFIAPLFSGLSEGALLTIERAAWWMHWIGILAFLNYIPFSKHFHIFLAFPNTFYGDLKTRGEMRDMPEIANEVKAMMDVSGQTQADPLPEDFRFGAKDATDLTWKNLMDAYSCTECGRCTDECPASQTGKLLSPRKIMMDTRDRIEEIGELKKAGETDEKTLYGDYILKEEIMACTTCNACVQACPVNINPLDIIYQVRRYIAMEEAGTPQEWNTMFTSMENNQAPWQFNPSDRMNWAENLEE